MAPEVDPNINPLIWKAIEQKRLLWFRYKDRERIVEPHDYGIHKGLIKLFAYQVAGSSSQKLPNWRWAEQPRGTLQNRPMRDTSKPANRTRQDRVSYSRFRLSKQGKSSPHST